MCLELIARLENSLRKTLCQNLPPTLVTKLYSSSRKHFLKSFYKQTPKTISVPSSLRRTLWGIEFRSPIFNAAGMFKNGEGYELIAAQGAGAYLAGTSTAHKRLGNSPQAFVPYPSSGSASNWLGLPNDSTEIVAQRLQKIHRVPGCPVGASLAASPEIKDEAQKLKELVTGLFVYLDAGVDFIEINESCPNTEEKSSKLAFSSRLEYISNNFIAKAKRKVPLIVKLSNDTELSQVPDIIDILLKLKFSAVNFGNTSTNYAQIKNQIAPREQKLFDYFTSRFGGGVSGRPLRAHSLELVKTASAHLKKAFPTEEFHIIQTGGVETAKDISDSLRAGASLVQWYTAYFESFSSYGNSLYQKLYAALVKP